MKILVTGSTGGIGAWVVKRLLQDGHSLRTIDVGAQPAGEYEHTPGDVRDMPLVRRLAQGCDAVVHLAAIPYDVERQDEQILDINIHGTYNILQASYEAGVQRVISFSSINALGQAEPKHPGLYLPLDDGVPHFNVRNYSLTKHIGEEMCSAFAARGTFTAVSLRPTAVTYPGPSTRFRWWDHMPEEIRMRQFKNDFCSYVDVRDVAEAVSLSLSASIEGHQAFLLASPESRVRSLTTAEVVEKFYPHLPWPKTSQADWLAKDEYVSLLDCSGAQQALGWRAKYSLFNPADGYE